MSGEVLEAFWPRCRRARAVGRPVVVGDVEAAARAGPSATRVTPTGS